jgi:hypothetical protein
MTFGNITLISEAFGIVSYEAALKLHDSVSPIRGRLFEVRPLSSGRRETVTISLIHPSSSVCIDHYGTTLLEYHPDNTVTINPYATKTSGNVFTALLGRSMGFSQCWTIEEPGPVTQIGYKYYYTPNSVTVDLKATPYPTLTEPPPPFVVPTLDKSKAAKLNHQLVKPMAKWLRTAIKLGVDPRGERYFGGSLISSSQIYELLKDGQPGWAYVAKDGMSKSDNLEDSLTWTRSAVYEAGGALGSEAYPYAEDYAELQRFRRRITDWS